MTIHTLSNSITAVAEFFELSEFGNGAALQAATVAEMASMFRNMAAEAVRLERAAKARGAAWDDIARAVTTPGSNIAVFPMIARGLPPVDPQPAA